MDALHDIVLLGVLAERGCSDSTSQNVSKEVRLPTYPPSLTRELIMIVSQSCLPSQAHHLAHVSTKRNLGQDLRTRVLSWEPGM